MLISMNWISDFTDLSGIDYKELIGRFTLSTAEVEDIYEVGRNVNNVVVGEILEIADHPKSKKLHLLKVNVGDEIVDCVCGAPNVFVGAYVPFAKVGGMVGTLEIKSAEIAGCLSNGMCCSEKELGISEDNSGLMILSKEYNPGTDIKSFMQLEDTVFEVDNKSLTNRPDLWGHYGIAREISVLTKRPLKPLDVFETEEYDSLDKISVEVQSDKVYRYSSISIANITKKVSPVNMKIRLTYCGIRPISLLVDLTNYLMLELGQPMHAFDNSIVKEIVVKNFENTFAFSTLDDIERTIEPETVMICNGSEPVAIAGIMGGASSQITEDTTTVLLESANFDGVSVRKSAVKLGLRTDASSRYEKILDPELTVPAIKRFLKLLVSIDPDVKVTSALTDCYVKKYDSVTIEFDKKYVDKYTGIDISADQIEETLTALGFHVTRNEDDFKAVVPSYRVTKDVTIKADIIEEITRIYGYDNFELKSTASMLKPVEPMYQRENEYKMKMYLAEHYAMNEVHSYIWYDNKLNKQLGIETDRNVKIMNSEMADNDTIKSTMIPSLIIGASKNLDTYSDVRIFEIGRVVKGLKNDGLCNERKHLGILLASKEKSEKELYFLMKEVLEQLTMNIKSSQLHYSEISGEAVPSYAHPVNVVNVYLNNIEIGCFGCIHPKIEQKIDKKVKMVFAEIDLENFEEYLPKAMTFDEVSKYPGSTVDLSFLVDKTMKYQELQSYLNQYENKNLIQYSFVEAYEDANVLKDKKSITVRFEFGSKERTLESQEINDMTAEILDLLGKEGIGLR
ncbi:phenylalanine--tRNA ligase subunit beta [Anaeromicropila populeti]|uniref:Phenylalanine--tRNA ligase beta subunit n=1 Tax=Anaeromicropila populeti TaxID=37658 RepID=A0A1I6IEA5_9FIRM|nr:phenylalanine--tRNA ligase subunit beta [Anaeromicropila populeti]SFR64959.1 phenylalanyl-tRNA synthetase beta subunit [Anaeromicropila populeti]